MPVHSANDNYTKKIIILNIGLVHTNNNINTTHWNENDTKKDLVGHQFRRDCVNDRNTHNQSESV